MRAPLWHRCHVCATVECQVPATEGACLACDEQNRNYIKSARLFSLSMRAYFRRIGVTLDEDQWQLDHPSLQMSALSDDPPAGPTVLTRDDEDVAVGELIGLLWRSHLIQSLGAGERMAAAWLGSAYGSQGQIAQALGVSQATVSRDQGNARRLLRLNFDDDFVAGFDVGAPIRGRRALTRPTLVGAA